MKLFDEITYLVPERDCREQDSTGRRVGQDECLSKYLDSWLVLGRLF